MKWLWNLDFCSWSFAGLSNGVYFAVNLTKYPRALWSIGAHKINYACNVSTIQQWWVSTGLFFPFLAWKNISICFILFYLDVGVRVFKPEGIFKGKRLFLKAGKPPSLDTNLPLWCITFFNKSHISVNHAWKWRPSCFKIFFYVCVRNMKCFSVAVFFPPHI